jgi:hypothetical protein
MRFNYPKTKIIANFPDKNLGKTFLVLTRVAHITKLVNDKQIFNSN